MPLHLHRAQRSDALAAGLADVLRDPLPDPMVTEILSVPARGIERWLTQRLSHQLGGASNSGSSDGGSHDGVCANVDFGSPAALVGRALSIAGGIDPDTDPWRVERMVWPLLATIDDCLGEPWCAALADHLGAGADAQPDSPGTQLRQARRLAVARRLAGLFDSYSAYRPAVLQAWAVGEDTDGCGEPLPPQRSWQPELFRRLRAAIGTPSPAERLTDACEVIRTRPEILDLPGRLSIFGPTRLSAQELAVLDAVAAQRDVHIWIPQPSPALWAALAHRAEIKDAEPIRRRADPTAGEPRHPLLRSLGRDSREFQLRLMSCRSTVVDHLHPDLGRSAGVLGQLQRDLAGDVPPPGAPPDGEPDRRPLLDPDDRSIGVHACHGRDRQVEVLRELLAGLLADHETLQPRDILVMCPDIETYAPLILAAFGSPDDPADQPDTVVEGTHPGTTIRVRLADRALRRTNPALDVLARVLELADSRMSASEVLDFAALPPVQRRFGFDDDDLQRLREWVIAAGVRWGLNAAGRAPYGLAELPQNTWRTGLDRILLGVAMSEDEPHYLDRALPLDDVDSSDIDLTGRLAELVDRLALVARNLTLARPLSDWVRTLSTALESLSAVGERDAWQLDQAQRTLRETLEHAGTRAGTVPLRLADLNGLLADALRGRPTRANFRTGELTICSMVPMRSVPHRVVCLMGLDDGEFPRTGRIDGDDVLALDPVVGERDRTSEDRQLMLDAINAATEHLVFLYSGADDRTGAQRPPAAALGEVLDVLDASVRTGDGERARSRLLIRHPLQPFDYRNFAAGELVPGRPFSFDRPALAGALAAGRPSAAVSGLLGTSLPPSEPTDSVELVDLIRFFEHPAKAFLRDRLGLAGSWSDDEISDELSVGLDNLQEWAIGERLLEQQLAGASAEAVQHAEFRRGTLPPGRQAGVVLRQLSAKVAPLVDKAAEFTQGAGEQHDVNVTLPDGRVITGTVGPIRDGVLTRVSYSKIGAKHRIRAWVSILALAAADPGFAPKAVTIGRGGKYQPVLVSRITPPAADRARAILAELVRIREFGLSTPLPLPPKTICTYVQARRTKGRTPEQALLWAGQDWTGSRFGGEGDDAEHRKIWGAVDLATVAAALGGPQEPVRGETGRWGELADAIVAPMLEAEVLGS